MRYFDASEDTYSIVCINNVWRNSEMRIYSHWILNFINYLFLTPEEARTFAWELGGTYLKEEKDMQHDKEQKFTTLKVTWEQRSWLDDKQDFIQCLVVK